MPGSAVRCHQSLPAVVQVLHTVSHSILLLLWGADLHRTVRACAVEESSQPEHSAGRTEGMQPANRLWLQHGMVRCSPASPATSCRCGGVFSSHSLTLIMDTVGGVFWPV